MLVRSILGLSTTSYLIPKTKNIFYLNLHCSPTEKKGKRNGGPKISIVSNVILFYFPNSLVFLHPRERRKKLTHPVGTPGAQILPNPRQIFFFFEIFHVLPHPGEEKKLNAPQVFQRPRIPPHPKICFVCFIRI